MSAQTKVVEVERVNVQPGDLAEHVGGHLDARRVTRTDGDAVWLDILGAESGPLPIENYTYSRWVGVTA